MATIELNHFEVRVISDHPAIGPTELWILDLHEDGYVGNVEELAHRIRSTLDPDNYELRFGSEDVEFRDSDGGFRRLFGGIRATTHWLDQEGLRAILDSIATSVIESWTPEDLLDFRSAEELRSLVEIFLKSRDPLTEGRQFNLVQEPDTSSEPPWVFLCESPPNDEAEEALRVEVSIYDPLGIVLHRHWIDPA